MATLALTYHRGRLSQEERLKIAELAGDGLGPKAISRRILRHPATINFHMLTHGLKKMTGVRMPAYQRNGITVRGFSDEEDRLIEELRATGASWARIAAADEAKFGHRRSAATIGVRLKMLATIDQEEC